MSEEKSFTVSGYLVIECSKWYGNNYKGRISKITKSKPAITNREIAIAINVKVPNAFFERLTPVINIELPSEAVANPDVEAVINLTAIEVADKLQLDVTDVTDGLRDLIKKAQHPLHTIENTP